MRYDKTLTIRVSGEMALALEEREKQTDLPTSNFVRGLIRKALAQNISVDDEPETSLPAPIIAKIQEKKAHAESAPSAHDRNVTRPAVIFPTKFNLQQETR
jgi:hypothetical protein